MSRPVAFGDRPLELATFDGSLLSKAISLEVNRVRLSFSLPPLAPNRKLDAAAEEQVSHLVLVEGVEHTNLVPGEETPRARVASEGMFPALIGENALMRTLPRSTDTYASFAASLVEGWMNSPGHRANILDQDFESSGVACSLGQGPRAGEHRVFSVQVFVRIGAPRH